MGWVEPIEKLPSYTIFMEGTTIHAKAGFTGGYSFKGKNVATIINKALSNLTAGRTWQERVLLQGDFTINATIQVPAYTIFELNGSVTLAAGSNCDILQNLNYGIAGDDWITIRGGYWFGDGNNQSSGDGFDFLGTSGDYIRYLVIEDLMIEDLQNHGIHLKYVTEHSRLHKVYVKLTRNGKGIWAEQFYDSEMCNVGVNLVEDCNLHLEIGESCQFSDIYLGGYSSGAYSDPEGQFVLENFHNSQFSNITSDSSWVHNTILRGASYHNQFSNLRISRMAYDGAKKNALLIQDTSIENTFSDIYIGERDESDDTGINFANAIIETDSADYNLFENVRANDCDAFYTLVGSHSRIRHAEPKTENRGTATIVNGTSGVSIPHGLALGLTPTIFLVGGRHGETDDVVIYARNAISGLSRVPANVTGNRTIDWYAEW